ncbi:DUF2127 domain-containing protein [Acidipila rosea]|uniref:Putative membrane protein n=1 Tax=Acidipila rosea TaxID=768535 RepID=A0A4R1LCG8_9BACT|nr:DUF2127 domain-containing protein [Acidipila rosea]TCK75884.1 putative membrane protein [Acidipila rosea]
MRQLPTYLRELLFRVSVWLKGFDAALEIVDGIGLWVVRPGWIVRMIGLLTQDEIAEDPHDFVANHLSHAASHFSLASEHFMAIYLLGHGIVKILVVVALLRNKLWAYPVAILVFGGFVVYQIYRFALTGSVGLIALSVIDLIVIWFIWLEYRAVKSSTSSHPATRSC